MAQLLPRRVSPGFRYRIPSGYPVSAVNNSETGLKRVSSKSTHRVLDGKRKRLYPDPEVGDVASEISYARHAIVEYRLTANHRIRTGCHQFQHRSQVTDVVLAIGVDLNGMAMTHFRNLSKSGHHRCAFAGVLGKTSVRSPTRLNSASWSRTRASVTRRYRHSPARQASEMVSN